MWVTSLPETGLEATLGALARVLMDSVVLKTLEFLLCGILIPEARSVVGELVSLFRCRLPRWLWREKGSGVSPRKKRLFRCGV